MYYIDLREKENRKTIVEIIVTDDGAWRYKDKFSDYSQPTELNMLNIQEATLLHQPCKDFLNDYDWEERDENGKPKIIGTYPRNYDSLLQFIGYRLANFKDLEDVIKSQNYDVTLFDSFYKDSEDENIVYARDEKCVLNIQRVN